MQARKEKIFYLGNPIDWSKFHVELPKTNTFTKGSVPIEWITSNVFYCPNGPNGEKLDPYFQIASQTIWGFSGCWNMNEAFKTLDNIEGYQICYSMTTMQSIESPTPEEKATKAIFDGIGQLVVDAMKKFGPMKDENNRKILTGPASNAYGAALGTGDWSEAVKPLYEYKMVGEKIKKADKTKPQRAYIKLDTKGKGQKLACITKIFGPGDKPVYPTKYMSSKGDGEEQGSTHRGKADIVIKFGSIFWGAHGKNPYGASASIRVAQMNYTPIVDDGGLKIRVLPRNTAQEEGEDENETFAFQSPLGDGDLNFDKSAFLSDDPNVNSLMGGGAGSEKVEIPEPEPSPPPVKEKEKVAEVVEKPAAKATPKKAAAKK